MKKWQHKRLRKPLYPCPLLVAGYRVVCYCDITSVDIRSSHILDIFIFIRQGLEINEIDLKHRRQGCCYCTAPSLRGNPSTTLVSSSTCSLGTSTCPSVQVLRKQKFAPLHQSVQNSFLDTKPLCSILH